MSAELPMVPPSCSLDARGASEQLARYRTAGGGAEVLLRDPRLLRVRLAPEVPADLVAALVETERGCCAFFGLDWRPERRELSVSVPNAEHEPALEAIALALGLEGDPEPGR